jgi:hypothetical protein
MATLLTTGVTYIFEIHVKVCDSFTNPGELTDLVREKEKYMNSRRAARWFVFKPRIPIWVNFGGPQK